MADSSGGGTPVAFVVGSPAPPPAAPTAAPAIVVIQATPTQGLPFTGFDASTALVLAVLLVLVGLAAVATGRGRRRSE